MNAETLPALAGQVEPSVRPAPKRGTVDRAEWLADKLHNGGDYGKEAAALLVRQAKELDYLRAGRENRAPAWVPARVWLAGPVRGDHPIEHTTIAHEGEYECHSNRYGAVSVTAENGKALGIKPGEFEVVAWRENKPNDRVEGRDAASSRRVPSHDGLAGSGSTE